MIGSTHNHSTGSDGKLTPEEVIKKAIKLNWDYIYFTDHYQNPRGILKEKAIKYPDKNFFNKKYLEEIKKFKKEYKNKIEVCFGVEFGWLESYKKWFEKEVKKQDFDYIIGSIHDLIDKNGKGHDLEGGIENWIISAEVFGGIKKYVQEYYKQIKNLINLGVFDSVGHLDYIKVYNKKQDLFSENEEWYKQEVLECLDLIKKKKMVLEINHNGIRKYGVPFPSLWIIKQAKKRNIPITLGLDAHYKEHYNNKNLKQLINIAKKAGYKEHVRFVKRKMIKMKL